MSPSLFRSLFLISNTKNHSKGLCIIEAYQSDSLESFGKLRDYFVIFLTNDTGDYLFIISGMVQYIHSLLSDMAGTDWRGVRG